MKSLLVCVALVIFSAISAQGQTPFWQSSAGPGGGEVRSMAMNGHNDVFAVHDSLYRSTDGGKSWEVVFRPQSQSTLGYVCSTPAGTLLLSVTACDTNNDNGIYRSTDNGGTWNKVVDRWICQSIVSRAGKTVALGSFSCAWPQGLVYSLDDGKTWTHHDNIRSSSHGINYNGDNTIQLISFDRAGNYYLGSGDILFESTNAGENWQKPLAPTSQYYVDFDQAADGTMYLLTRSSYLRNTLYSSVNNGKSWSTLTGGGDVYSETLRTLPDNSFVLAPTDNDQFFSSHSGSLFAADSLHGYSTLYGGLKQGGSMTSTMEVDSTGKLYLSTREGLYASTDAAATWSAVATPFGVVHAVLAMPDGAVIAGTGSWSYYTYDPPSATISSLGSLWRSPDGGTTWAEVPVSDNTPYTLGAVALDSSYRAIASCGGNLFSSTTDGRTWSKFGRSFNGVTAIAVGPSGDLYVGTYSSGISYSSDGGTSWSDCPAIVAGRYEISSLSVDQDGQLFAGVRRSDTLSHSSYLMRSGDRGQSWKIVDSSSSIYAITAHADAIYASVDGSGVIRSVDKGATWQTMGTGLGSLQATALAVSRGNDCFVGTPSGVYRLQDGGASWVNVDGASAHGAAYALALTREGNLFVGGDRSGLSRSVATFNISTNEVRQSAPAMDIQILPNPTDNWLSVRFGSDIPTLIEIVDALGRTLERRLMSRSDEEKFDVSHYPNGCYFIRMISATNSVSRAVTIER